MSEYPEHDFANIHEVLTSKFTDRYLQDHHVSKIAYAQQYDPNNELCDYEKTWWEATPHGRLSLLAGRTALTRLLPVTGRQMDEIFVPAFEERSGEMQAALLERPLMLVTDHNPDLVAALVLVSAGMALARHGSRGSYGARLNEMFNLSHVVATRAFAPVVIGRPELPVGLSLVRLARHVLNPHFSFPRNKKMLNSGISEQFMKSYNEKMKQAAASVAREERGALHGYHGLWAMAPAGTRNNKPDPAKGRLYETIPEVRSATTKLMQALDCRLVLVKTNLPGKRGRPTLEIGEIMEPEEVTAYTVHNMMSDMAAYQTAAKGRPIFYEPDAPAPDNV